MRNALKKEIKAIIKKRDLNCPIRHFNRYINWVNISNHQTLSEEFITKFKDKVDWLYIYQNIRN